MTLKRVHDVDISSLRLGPITPAFSGASAQFEGTKSVLQTPWLQVAGLEAVDGKTVLWLNLDENMSNWLFAVESRVQEQIPQHIRDVWKSSVSDEDVWKVNLANSVPRFGDDISPDCLVALAIELVGAWFWKEMSGMKVKIHQIKGLKSP